MSLETGPATGSQGAAGAPSPPEKIASEPQGAISTIADLSYRGYGGPRRSRAVRWWIVAVAGLRYARKSPVFWILAGLAAMPFLFTGITLVLAPAIGSFPGGNPFSATPNPKHAVQFYQALSNQGFFVFLAAITIGAGAISADNRTNALLIYLAKPLTKGDYLLGKWMGLFLPLYAVALAPSLLLYAFCVGSYANSGFLHDEPWLLPRLILACAVPAMVHTSLLLGISAWSRRPAFAGAGYASLYFLSSIVIFIIWQIRYRDQPESGQLLHSLSISGVINGLAQNIYAVSTPGGFFHRSTMQFNQSLIAPPSLSTMLAVVAILVVSGILAARLRIRAVEVVRG